MVDYGNGSKTSASYTYSFTALTSGTATFKPVNASVLDYSSTNLFNKFIYIGGIYALIRANTFVRQFIGGISTDISQSVKSFTSIKH